jgi:hypothetical protein
MRVKIKRIPGIHNTPGDLGVYDDNWNSLFLCKSLELPWNNNKRKSSCIPTGTYTVVARYSEKFGNHFHVLNVPDRDLILIHVGNYAALEVGGDNEVQSDVLGCILVGNVHKDINSDGVGDIGGSKVTMRKLLKILPKKFELIIE